MIFLLRNQQGQSLIEVIIMGILMALVISCLLGLIYVMYSSYWAEHILYESLICNQERGSRTYCVREARTKLNRILFLQDDFDFFIYERGNFSSAQMKMVVRFPVLRNFTLKFKKELRT